MSHPMVRSWEFAWSAEGRSPTTMREMKRMVDRFEAFLAAEGGDLMTATRQDCEQFIASLASPNRKAWAWRSMRSFYAVVSDDLEQPSPMARIKSPKVPLSDTTVATEDDISKLLRACAPFRTATNCRDAAIVSVLWASGMRRTECANLKVSDLDLDALSVLIRTSKSGKARRAPLDERSAQHLARWLAKRATYPAQDGDALWWGKRGVLTSDGIRLVIQRRRAKAGVDVSAHAFRRGWTADALGRRGISQTSVMTAAGWRTSHMPSLYTRSVKEDLMLSEFHRDRNGGDR
jgi:site-specific recombinase XerD